MNFPEDTIAAIATPIGVGGISVIRISGKDAIQKIDKIFQGKHALTKVKTHTAHFGKMFFQNGSTIDEVVVTVFKAPKSYTAENLVEISCHGGYYVTKILLENILSTGIRHAQPGEFTKRAFLNGRIDLIQAEAVADMINSSTTLCHLAAMAQLEGKLSTEIKNIRERLLELSSSLELELDFSEEDIKIQNKSTLTSELDVVINQIGKWINSYSTGKIIRDGFRVAIVGKPNVGKSSIFNELLFEERAIVTEIPGTTRDVIEENVTIGGILFKISDTAGMRDNADFVEMKGINKTKLLIGNSDLVILVIDPTQGITDNDNEIRKLIIEKGKSRGTKYLMAINKYDLAKPEQRAVEQFRETFHHLVIISAKTGYGFNELKKTMVELALKNSKSDMQYGIIITNERHKESLTKAKRSLANAKRAIENNTSNEFVAFEINEGVNELGEIIGAYSSEEILNNIFSKFCVGK